MLDLSLVNNTHWLTNPDHLKRYLAKLGTFTSCPSAREVALHRRERMEEFKHLAERAAPIRASRGKIGVIPIHGPIEQRQSSELMKLGGTSTEEIGAALDVMLADKSIEQIVLHVDSPGGGVYGVEELSDKIFAARGSKKIYAHADSMAASAGYWIASAASTFAMTPGGEVGSVGVFAVHVDQSAALAAEGLAVTVVSAGKYKAEWLPVSPLTSEARAFAQESVDDTYMRFLSAVKRNRGATLEDVRANYGEGRTMSSDKALARRMVDRVIPFEELLGRLTGNTGSARRAAMDVARRAHERRKLGV